MDRINSQSGGSAGYTSIHVNETPKKRTVFLAGCDYLRDETNLEKLERDDFQPLIDTIVKLITHFGNSECTVNNYITRIKASNHKDKRKRLRQDEPQRTISPDIKFQNMRELLDNFKSYGINYSNELKNVIHKIRLDSAIKDCENSLLLCKAAVSDLCDIKQMIEQKRDSNRSRSQSNCGSEEGHQSDDVTSSTDGSPEGRKQSGF